MPGIRRFLIAAAIVVGFSTVLIIDPAEHPLIPACPSRSFLGIFCPGCGSVRALHALLHLDVEQALAMNPVTLAFLLYLGVLGSAIVLKRDDVAERLTGQASARLWLVGLLAFWILRNLPWMPFDRLAPGA